MQDIENFPSEQQENIAQPETIGQETPTTPSFFEKLKNRWPLAIVVTLGSLLAFTAIVYAIYSYSKRDQEIQPTPTVAVTQTPTLGETADWKIYKSEEYGFELRYPANHTAASQGPNDAQQGLDAGEQISGTQPPSFDTIVFTAPNEQEFSVAIYHSIRIEFNQNYGIAGDCGSQFAEETLINRLTTVNGIKFLERRQRFVENKVGIDYCFVGGTNNLITLRSRNIDSIGVDKIDNFLRLVLSTIIVTQAPTPSKYDATATWSTYINTDYNFSFKYPTTLTTVKEPPTSGYSDCTSFRGVEDYQEAVGLAGNIVPLLVCVGDKNASRQDAYFGSYKWVTDLIPKLEKLKNNETMSGKSPGSTITKKAAVETASITAQKYQENPGEGGVYTGVIFVKESNSYLLIFRRLTPQHLTEEGFDQLISTFKFLTSNEGYISETKAVEKVQSLPDDFLFDKVLKGQVAFSAENPPTQTTPYWGIRIVQKNVQGSGTLNWAYVDAYTGNFICALSENGTPNSSCPK